MGLGGYDSYCSLLWLLIVYCPARDFQSRLREEVAVITVDY